MLVLRAPFDSISLAQARAEERVKNAVAGVVAAEEAEATGGGGPRNSTSLAAAVDAASAELNDAEAGVCFPRSS